MKIETLKNGSLKVSPGKFNKTQLLTALKCQGFTTESIEYFGIIVKSQHGALYEVLTVDMDNFNQNKTVILLKVENR